MAFRRRGWDSLSPAYRNRLKRNGITRRAYESGASLEKARGHGAKDRVGIMALTTEGKRLLWRDSVNDIAASKIGVHWNGVKRLILHNDSSVLDRVAGYRFKARQISRGKIRVEKWWTLMSDFEDIERWWLESDTVRFEEIYENVRAA